MQVNLAQSRRGNLVISVPRTGRTWLFLASALGALGLGAASLFSAFPQWARLGGTLIAGSALALIAWRLLPAARVEFDAGHGNVLKDGWRVARFGEIECVQLSERGLGKEALYVVELRLADGALLFLGHTRDQMEAASAAARVSGAVGRPVKVAYG